ncbi:MAG: pectin acetylesterase-family hydrolase [Myxococcales bacterium]|jgi:hypothetical protein
MWPFRFLVLTSLLFFSVACGDDDAGADPDAGAGASADAGADAGFAGNPAPAAPADLQELLDLGIDEFLGAAQPADSETLDGIDGVADGSVVYDFDPDDGPICLRGAPFQMSLLDQGSDDLVIYLQGGGACVSAICQATEQASPRGVPQRGLLDTGDPDNPVADWNLVYVPYCDGSVFAGDSEIEEGFDAQGARHHRGQRNFSAALDRALEHFPNPGRVLLAGSSAGGWGTVYHRALVRHVYPDAQLFVLNDAGLGLSTNYSVVAGPWGSIARYQPESCERCSRSPHMLEYVKWYMGQDPSVVVGDFSAWQDSVIQRFTFSANGEALSELIAAETQKPADAYPERYKRFFIDGSSHTALGSMHDTQIDGVTFGQWIGWMIDRDPRWQELLQ